MTNDNTRTKANAVFFSALMVISMVAVGFAAAPAAAANVTDEPSSVSLGPGDSVNFEVELDSSGSINTVSNLPNGVTSDYSDQSTTSPTVELTAGSNANVVQRDLTLTTDSGDTTTVALNPDRSNAGSGENQRVYDGSIVFQGEEDITFYNNSSDSVVPAATLSKDQGDSAGTTLSNQIGENKETGTYSNDNGFQVVVQEPTISTAEVQYQGSDIEQIASENAGALTINATWDFATAESVEVTVEDESGTDITNAVLSGDSDPAVLEGYNDGGVASVDLNLRDEDAGEYTVIFEGTDDLDGDSVIQEYSIETTSQDSLVIDAASETAVQGDNVQYTVSGGLDGSTHVIAIAEDDLRDGTNVTDNLRTLRNVGDTQRVGLYGDSGVFNASEASRLESSYSGNLEDASDRSDNIEYAFAVVEIDGTQAVGSVETQYLDDSSIDVEVYQNSTPDTLSNMSPSEDDVSIDVEEGDVSIESPDGTYVVGEEVDVNGTADSAEDVGIYVQDNNNWEPVNIDGDQFITVDSDDTFEESDVVLSDADKDGATADDFGGSQTLSFAGRYDIGVIDQSDVAPIEQNDGSISSSDFSSASSSRYSITVTEGDLGGSFSTVNGQIAEEDGTVDVTGTAEGQNNVVVAFVDNRGQTEVAEVSVDGDGTFERDDIDISGLNQGTVSGHIISLGRDGTVGDDSLLSGADGSNNNGRTDTPAELASFIDGISSGSGDQVRSRILSNTVDADGSDDLIISETFRLNDATLSVDNVYPEDAESSGVNPVATGETVVIEGTTNRQADDNSITLDMLTQEENSVTSASTDEWSDDGQWEATIDTSDLETGTYIIEADDGESTDRVNVEIVEEREDPSDDSSGDDSSGDDSSGDDSSGDDSSGDDSSGDDSSGDDSSGDDSSGDDSSGDDSSGDDSSGDDSSGDDSSGDDSTDDGTPGFGALVALVALIAAALLATRRNE